MGNIFLISTQPNMKKTNFSQTKINEWPFLRQFSMFYLFFFAAAFLVGCSEETVFEELKPGEESSKSATLARLDGNIVGNGVNIQPSYYCNGDQEIGWSLMLQYPDIQSVRIEIEPDKQATIQDAARWISEAHANGLEVIATYHRYEDNGSPDPGTLMTAANWWKANYATLSASGPIVVNLMNEWGDHNITSQQYADAYNQAISIVREVYSGAIICDIPGWGQETHVAAHASPLITDTNIVFSVHVYPASYNGYTGSSLANSDLDYLESAGRPALVGEFGSEGRGGADWSALVDHAKSLGWPVLGWAWNGDGSSPVMMNMVSPYWGDDCSATAYSESSYFSTIYDKLGTGSGGGGSDTTAPASPTNLSGVASSKGKCSRIRVNLNWDDNSESDLAGYNVYRSTQAGVSVSSGTKIASGLSSSSFEDANVSNGTTYYYVVTAVDITGNESTGSNEANATTCGSS